MSIRDIPRGESLIPAIERDFPEMSGWSKTLRDENLYRCEICSKIDFDEVSQTSIAADGISRGPKHHASWAELKASAIEGCHLCKLFQFVKVESDKQASKYSQSRPKPDGQLYIKASSSTLELGRSFMDQIRLHLCTDKDCPQDKISNGDEFRGVPTRLVEDNPASAEAFARAQRWIDYCRANHPHCIPNEDVPLPTRVLNIQTSIDSGKVNLFISNGVKSKYASLSHCWGGASTVNDETIRTCTVETFEELKNGISISRLPKTFRDAITVTQKLGIPYLWIDSLCIRQDSREDWSLESAKMSEVYGNSYLTILASSADDSNYGFLNQRDPKRCIMTKFCPVPKHPEHWVWVRWPTSDGPWTQWDRKITHRAWAFQEYSLPPRVLEYAPTALEWHCNQIKIEESTIHLDRYVIHDTYKELMWILSLPHDTKSLPSEDVSKNPYFAGDSKELTIYNRWYELVEGYSARKLTYETDRLPAVAGLARKIQDISHDTYMAGLWKRDLGAGLCWKVRGFGDLQRPSKYVCPSWSWASLQGSITHSIPDNHLLAAELLEYQIKTDGNNPLGEVISGSITLLAPMRKLKVAQGTVHIEHVEIDEDVHDWIRRLENDGGQKKFALDHFYALRDQDDVADPRGTGICSICYDINAQTDVKEVFLLQLLADGFDPVPRMYDDKFAAFGIVLEKAIDEESLYRRIGVYSIVDAMAPFIAPGDNHSALRGWSKVAVTII